jgi:SpoVK/Ycf46/Vps4 family AAA+-type ATPase
LDEAIADLLEACRARPNSAALQRALMDAVAAPTPPEVLDWLARADPAPHDDGHRHRVAQFLSEGGRDTDAGRWEPLAATEEKEAGVEASASSATPGATPSATPSATVVRLFQTRPDDVAPPASAEPVRPAVTFADIGGLETVKQQVRRRIISPFEKPGLFQAFRKRSGGGVLMYGPPGCGKTMLARATAGEAKAHFVAVAITDILDKYFGESERKLAQAFAQARARRPAVLFFDELEALASRRRASGEIGASVVSTFLSEMDGFSGSGDGVLVLAATNTPWAVDPAFRRPGRFDRVLFIPPPDQPARLAIMTSLLSGRPLAPGLDLHRFAVASAGFSGADIANLVETATELAIEDSTSAEDLTPISRRHLEAAMKEVRPTTGEWLTTARNYARYANEGGIYDDVLAFLEKHAR